MIEVSSISDLDEVAELQNEVNRLTDENSDLKAKLDELETQVEEMGRAYQEMIDEVEHISALMDRLVK